MRRIPGVEANPVVRRSSPTSTLVWGSGSNRAPISKVMSAHAAQAISARIAINRMFDGLVPPRPRAPTPAAKLDMTTTAHA